MSIKDRIKNIEKSEYYKVSNLHVHSNYSDGKDNFLNLIKSAQNLGLKNFAITDHNSIEGYLVNDTSSYGFLIPAVEFDVVEDFILVHILGYGIDPNNKDLQAICAKDKDSANHVIPRLLNARKAKKTIDAIHSAGGIAVLAHPCCMWAINLEHFVKKLIKMGLDGIEVYYPYRSLRGIIKFHNEDKIEHLAEKYNLIKTGGTDCHTKLEEDLL